MLDLPQPLGPTMARILRLNRILVRDGKDLNPEMVKEVSCMIPEVSITSV